MALRKDYIQRQFEEFGKVLAVILRFKLDKDWDNFEKELYAASRKFTSTELDMAENLSAEEFASQVLLRKGMELDEKKILARLLFEKLEYYVATGDQRATPLKTRCEQLYTYLLHNMTENEFDLDVHYKLELIRKMNLS